eukprot:8205146-Prorocentrum_lima.AAC.1
MRCPVVIGTSSSSLASNAQLQEFCCGSVMDMARSMDILREQLASLKAGDAVVAAMKTHRDVAGVQARGNGAIWKLSIGGEATREHLASLRAGDAILASMKA